MNPLREQARELRRQGKSLPEIVRQLEAPKGTVFYWIRDIALPEGARSRAVKKGWVRRSRNYPVVELPESVQLKGASKQKGDVAQLVLLARLATKGYVVLTPYGDNQRYDIVVDCEGKFERIQVKAGKLVAGAIHFSTCSSYRHRGRGARDYRGQVEFFGVYCPDLDKSYLVPVELVGKRLGSLRVLAPKNGQKTRLRWAKKFEV